MAIWKAYKITDVLTEIDEERFVLPVIQRRLVWDEEKMELLFDTLLRGDSFGGVMVIEEEKGSKPLFNYRPFTKDGNSISSREVDKLAQVQSFVIDGQQRLQSFYIGLRGSINGKILYFDLFSDFNSEYEFKFESESSKLPKKPSDLQNRVIPEHCWYQAGTLLKRLKDTNDEDQVADEIIKTLTVEDSDKQKHIIKNIKAFYKNTITADCLGISKVIVNKSLDELSNKQRIVELFRRLNDGGTKLSSFDLVASILKGFAWEMEGFLEDTLKSYDDIGLTQDNLLKMIFLFQDNHKKEMASLESGDAEFAIKNRDRILSTLKALKDFLTHSKLHNYYKGGSRSFIPLFFISYHLFHKELSNRQIERYFDNFETGNEDYIKMKKWIYHSLLNGVFKSKGVGWIPYKTGVRKLLEKIQIYKDLEFPTEVLFDVYATHPVIFTTKYSLKNLHQLDSSFVYYLIYDRETAIRVNDVDHIFPRSILEELGFDYEKINNIGNFQLLDSGTNRGLKNGKAFSIWINNHVLDKSTYLNHHLIPNDEETWKEKDFLKFLDKRLKLILDKILFYTN